MENVKIFVQDCVMCPFASDDSVDGFMCNAATFYHPKGFFKLDDNAGSEVPYECPLKHGNINVVFEYNYNVVEVDEKS